MSQSAVPAALLWVRRDLRLTDNPALIAAVEHGGPLIVVYVHAPHEDAEWAPGAASRWWLHRSLVAFDAELRARGARLCVRRGNSLDALLALARASGANAVFWNRLYEPASVSRDTTVKTALREAGLQAESFNGALLVEPWQVRTGAGQPYRVFTPYWRSARQSMASQPPRPAPVRIPAPAVAPGSLAIESLELLPTVRWDAGLASAWQPGEHHALARLDSFCSGALARYDEGRNRPDQHGSSRLSAHLHFGEVSPRQCLAAVTAALAQAPAAAGAAGAAEAFVRELGWREFAHHLLFHFPQTPALALDTRFERFTWDGQAALLSAWQRGQTGFPLVDAGMRELWHTGWMHNRVRMITASLLTKNLLQHWLDGARWFWDTLVDADLAGNTLGWQWTAGCGADASPYFRVFNPMLQGERHDPQRAYLRHWLPELAALPDAWVHRPAQAPAGVLAAAGVELGVDYPRPVVDFQASRARALAAYGAMAHRPG